MLSSFLPASSSKIPTGKSVPPTSVVNFTQQKIWSRLQTVALAASSGVLGASNNWPTGKFVQPDLIDATDEVSSKAIHESRWRHIAGQPTFRSALEQVSYDTNNSLMEKADARFKDSQHGLFSRAARIFGRA